MVCQRDRDVVADRTVRPILNVELAPVLPLLAGIRKARDSVWRASKSIVEPRKPGSRQMLTASSTSASRTRVENVRHGSRPLQRMPAYASKPDTPLVRPDGREVSTPDARLYLSSRIAIGDPIDSVLLSAGGHMVPSEVDLCRLNMGFAGPPQCHLPRGRGRDDSYEVGIRRPGRDLRRSGPVWPVAVTSRISQLG